MGPEDPHTFLQTYTDTSVSNHLILRGSADPLDIPKHSMYGIFTNIGVVLGVNVCKYAIAGVSGISDSWIPGAEILSMLVPSTL